MAAAVWLDLQSLVSTCSYVMIGFGNKLHFVLLHHGYLKKTKKLLSVDLMCCLCLCCFSISAVSPVLALLRRSMARSVACVDAATTQLQRHNVVQEAFSGSCSLPSAA